MIDLAREIVIDRRAARPITRQLIEGIRALVRGGRLAGGQKLPSTRELATSLAISRNSVAAAYEQLVAEGFLVPRRGSGTYVAAGIRSVARAAAAAVHAAPSRQAARRRPIRFHSGNPDLHAFPVPAWALSLRNAAQRARPKDLGYGRTDGVTELREAVAQYVYRARGVACTADDVIIVSGIAEAIDLLCKLRPRAREAVLIEDPCLEHARSAFEMAGCRLVPVPVDEAGMQVEALPDRPAAFCLYTVPCHQYPLGSILSAPRRQVLVDYARRHDLWILEDDYDSEFRYTGCPDCPVEPLQGLAPERVLYFGTFSKSLYPGLRLAFLVAPRGLLPGLRSVKQGLNVFCSAIEQLTLCQWIRDGRYDAHVHRMRKLYRAKRQRIVDRVGAVFGSRVRVLGANAGLHLLLELAGAPLKPADLERCREAGVEVDWVEDAALVKGRHRNQIVVGYGALSDAQIDEGVRILGAALSTRV